MPAKWQQWMPFDILAFKSSAVVRAMNSAGRTGYLYLLTAMWQTEDCTLSSDEYDLYLESGMTQEEWDRDKKLILRNFITLENGRLRNKVVFTKWEEAKRIFESRQKSALDTVKSRSAHGDRKKTKATPSRRAYTQTETVTTTQDQKPSVAAAPVAKSETSSLHERCKALVHADWQKHHPGEDLAPWDGSEAKQLQALLAANPRLTEEGFQRLLGHRARSEVNLSQRPREWLGKLRDFTKGPLDRFGKPLETRNGVSQGSRSPAVERADRKQAASDAAFIARYGTGAEDVVRSDAGLLPQSGIQPGHDYGVPVRHGAPGDAVRAGDGQRSPAASAVAARPEVFSSSDGGRGRVGHHD